MGEDPANRVDSRSKPGACATGGKMLTQLEEPEVELLWPSEFAEKLLNRFVFSAISSTLPNV
jgi:hypothetical protein